MKRLTLLFFVVVLGSHGERAAAQNATALETLVLNGVSLALPLQIPGLKIDTILWEDSTLTGLLIYPTREFGADGEMRISQMQGFVTQASFSTTYPNDTAAHTKFDSLWTVFQGLGSRGDDKAVVQVGPKNDTTVIGYEVGWHSEYRTFRINWSGHIVTLTFALKPVPPPIPVEMLEPHDRPNEPQEVQPTRKRRR